MLHLRTLVAAASLALALPFGAVAEDSPGDAGGLVIDNRCVVWFRLTSGVSVSNLDFTVDYGPADGSFLGQGNSVECGRALGGTTSFAYRDRDIDGLREFKVSMIRLNNFTGPADLAACRWLFNDDPPAVGDFSVLVTNAGRRTEGSTDVEDIRPLPRVRVDRVVCPGSLPTGLTTTTTSTTTTLTSPSSTVTTSTLPIGGGCGVPASGGDTPQASDALFALQAAVSLKSCDLCICDVDSSGHLAASDALAILRAAVGSGGPLDCVPCLP